MNININKSIRILLLVIISSFLIISSLIAQTDIPAGNVSGTWALSGSPFRVNGEIAVPEEMIKGKHISSWSSKSKEPQFTAYKKRGLDASKIEEHIEMVKGEINKRFNK